jgi:DNA-binding CsgD family transcriptional regulator
MTIKLSPQQAGIVEAVIGGYTTRKEISAYIGVKRGTLAVHMYRLFNKIGANNIADVVLWAWRNGYQLPQAAGDD